MAPSQDRRSFLRWATTGLGAIFAALLGTPVVVYLVDPRNRKAPPSEFRPVDGINLEEIADLPIQGVIRDVRVDGWTLHPSDVLGRVWVVKDDQAPKRFRVFTTICPHLGCSVNLEGNRFACPCHGAKFALDGNLDHDPAHRNPALRGMDELDWERDEHDPQRILVRYQAFVAGTREKTVIGS
jgi:Rieske Fe-S protein